MNEVRYIIQDALGIHARPAGRLVKFLSGFTSHVTIGVKDAAADGKRLIQVMRLAAKQGDELFITFDGDDAGEAAQKTLAFLRENL